MTNFIPIVILENIILPEEQLNLHVLDNKYVQLFEDCLKSKKYFGILSELKGELREYGTLMEVLDVSVLNNDEGVNIKTKGLKIFRILEAIQLIPDKLYSGAIVTYPENEHIKMDQSISDLIIKEVQRLYTLLNLEEKFPAQKKDWSSYEIAQKIGFSNDQKYEMLSIFNELQRMEYIRRHLHTIMPVVKELEDLKSRVKLNGHFKNISSGNAS